MKFPTATYRLQFRNGMTFDRASALVPYLKKLGISHLYASPIFTATSESTHGYDITDANEIDPAIGGRAGFDRMVEALKDAGLGLILDIVPNHMAASLETPWWKDVMEHGAESRYARHFDVDWSRRLTLPVLGDDFDAVLEAGDLAIKSDPKTGKPVLAYFESLFPLHPSTYDGREAEILKISDKASVSELHDQQPYRLMSWRDAARDLSYRRFFEVTGLAGVRVEDKAVFEDSHRLILELVHSGAVQGLRLDHIDGLADPKGYLDWLREAVGPDCYIVVEKILGEGEQLPADWPVSGTTGYEFIAALSHALVDGKKLEVLQSAYEALGENRRDAEEQLRAAKLLMVSRNFEGEVSVLVALAAKIAEQAGRRTPESELKDALSEMLIAFTVYRTYGTPEGLRADDKALLDQVIEATGDAGHAVSIEALALITGILKGEVPSSAEQDAVTFRTKFQQLTGPIMAKSIEDTLFFRHNLLLGLNEVGAEPIQPDFSLDHFHEEMRIRKERQPKGISGTSTHDTKRGEDARARLYALSEAPDVWIAAVEDWRETNAKAVRQLPDGPAPEPEVEWMIYQALAGFLPPRLDADDEKTFQQLKDRFLTYLEKALREAKLRTDWGDSNEAYEEAVLGYASHLFSLDNRDFLKGFAETIKPFIEAGLANSLTQTIIKLMAPGIPDIYQGSEGFDFSLVDPDNRREPDYDALSKRLAEGRKPDAADVSAWYDGSVKQSVIATLLHLRQAAADLFNEGDYVPLRATSRSGNLVAFARVHGEQAVLVVVPRFTLARGADQVLPPTLGGGVTMELPAELSDKRFQNVWTEDHIETSHVLELDATAEEQPFLVLRTA
ncbi:malto-oligosyltrehalose synthase [Agrobacterium larrymoorei]|uniref:(1->4)-alpha-D-glucan 1-alpha-D-glucosylmutase n=1 Tax=Agrobacterium larrymoorei TaxID=160699 RepID=A0ABU0UFM8_9HYPH|nr:malto-oligosyltrehalose synthase [Agrobacterium larrymoorei]MDQ1183747.1 (1->4)-alpha-D-glucan 1-alpha-D-glucosylmutase [Agrobacterium larrymoorei]